MDDFDHRVDLYRKRPPTQADASRLRFLPPEAWDKLLDVAYVAAKSPRDLITIAEEVLEPVKIETSGRGRAIDEEERANRIAGILLALSQGLPPMRIADQFGVSKQYVYALRARGGEVREPKKRGRPPKSKAP